MTTDRFTKQDTVRIDIRLYQTPICKYLPLNCIMYRDNSCRIFAVVIWWVWILRSSLEFDKQLIMSNELIQRMWTSQQAATLLPMTLSARANVFHTHVLMTPHHHPKQRKKTTSHEFKLLWTTRTVQPTSLHHMNQCNARCNAWKFETSDAGWCVTK